MSRTIDDKQKLLNRIGRIRGQLDAVQRHLEQEDDCSTILQTIAASRGAIDGLMAELIVGHIQLHLTDPKEAPSSERTRAAKVLIDVVRAYLK